MSTGYDSDDVTGSDDANIDAANQALITSLSGPQSVSSDAGSVTSHPITGIIDAANYLAGLAAAKTRRLGIRYTHLRPGGTVQGRRKDPRWRDGPEI